MKKLFCILAIMVIAVFFHTQAETNLSLDGRVIILDAGHGLGASNRFAGYDEQVRMLLLAQKIQRELEARGATVYMTRPAQADVLLPVRVALMNKWSLEAIRAERLQALNSAPPSQRTTLQNEIAEINRLIDITERIIRNPGVYAPIYINTPFDMTLTRRIHPDWRRIFELQSTPLIRNNFLVISLHSNASPSLSVNGADVFFSTNCNPRNINYFANYSHEDNMRIFGDILLDNIHNIGINRRSVIPHHWLIIRENNLPSVLVENGFHTNARDRSLLMDDNFMARLAMVYVNSIEKYFAVITPEVVEEIVATPLGKAIP